MAVPKSIESKVPKTLCIGGRLPSGCKKTDYREALCAIGYELVNEVTGGLRFLVLADSGSTSGKAEKARKFGVEVISEEQLIALTSRVVLKDLTKRSAKDSLLNSFSAHQLTSEDSAFIEKYASILLPYCLPTFLRFDRSNTAHRLGDMVGGFPYTNSSHPWPKCKNGLFQQPIVQMDLKEAGSLLGLNLGDGLLQVWGNVIPEGWQVGGGWPFQKRPETLHVRVVPQVDLIQAPDTFYPPDAPWDIPDEELDISATHSCLMRFEKAHIVHPRISWDQCGYMFSPHYIHDGGLPVSDEFHSVFYHCLVNGAVSNPNSRFNPRETYLGGFGGGGGGQNEPFPFRFADGEEGQLLFNTMSDGDSYSSVTLAVYFRQKTSGETEFETTYYHYA